jgi:hypothetical protein
VVLCCHVFHFVVGFQVPDNGLPSEGVLRGEWHRTFLFLNMYSRYALPLLDEKATQFALSAVDAISSDAVQHVDLFLRKFCIPGRSARGLLLYGPPGTRKSFYLSRVVEHSGLHLINQVLNANDVIGRLVGETESRIRHLLDRGAETPWFPCALVFDEVDALVLNRERHAPAHDGTPADCECHP